jgi:hypothetical protein
MPDTYDISDDELGSELASIIAGWGVGPFTLHLFQNDYTPVPGTTLGSFSECNYPGYSAAPFDPSGFSIPVVTAHVANSTLSSAVSFVADPSGFSSQPAYGYYVTSVGGAYLWSVRFETTVNVTPGLTVNVTPQRSHKTC